MRVISVFFGLVTTQARLVVSIVFNEGAAVSSLARDFITSSKVPIQTAVVLWVSPPLPLFSLHVLLGHPLCDLLAGRPAGGETLELGDRHPDPRAVHTEAVTFAAKLVSRSRRTDVNTTVRLPAQLDPGSMFVLLERKKALLVVPRRLRN